MKKEVLLIILFMISSVSAQLADSPWPTFMGNAQRTGLSQYDTSHVDGTIIWTFKAGGGIESSPAIGLDGTIYVGSHDGYLYAVNPDGTLKWKTKLATPIEKEHYGHLISIGSSPAIGEDGTIYIASQDQYLHAVSSQGKEKWKFSIGHSFDAWASPVIGEDGTIYITSSKPKAGLYAINPDGTEKWKYNAGANMFNSPSIGKDGTIYVGMPTGPKTNELIAINTNGKKIWNKKTSLFLESSPTVTDEAIYIGSFVDGQTGAGLYSITDGKENWYFKTQTKEVMATAAIGSDGTIYFGDYRDEGSQLHALTPDGKEKWSVDTVGPISSSPAIGLDGTIYFGVSSAKKGETAFFALNPDGTVKWSYDKGGSFASSPAIGKDGTVYAADWGGNLYAFGSSDQIIIEEEEIIPEPLPTENETFEWHPKDHDADCFEHASDEIKEKCDKFCSDHPDYCPGYFEREEHLVEKDIIKDPEDKELPVEEESTTAQTSDDPIEPEKGFFSKIFDWFRNLFG